MDEIERIFDTTYGTELASKYPSLVEALNQHVIRARIEELELALGKESLNMYHAGGILTKLEWLEHRVAELKKGLK